MLSLTEQRLSSKGKAKYKWFWDTAAIQISIECKTRVNHGTRSKSWHCLNILRIYVQVREPNCNCTTSFCCCDCNPKKERNEWESACVLSRSQRPICEGIHPALQTTKRTLIGAFLWNLCLPRHHDVTKALPWLGRNSTSDWSSNKSLADLRYHSRSYKQLHFPVPHLRIHTRQNKNPCTCRSSCSITWFTTHHLRRRRSRRCTPSTRKS